MNNRVIYNNPGLKTLDVTTATGIGYALRVANKGTLHINLSNSIVNTAIVNTSTPAVASLQLIRGGTTYTLATQSFVNGAIVGQEVDFTPATAVALPSGTIDFTRAPFLELEIGDVIQTNITTAGLGGTPAGAYEVNLVIDKASVTV
jgi:hypothetical protein